MMGFCICRDIRRWYWKWNERFLLTKIPWQWGSRVIRRINTGMDR